MPEETKGLGLLGLASKKPADLVADAEVEEGAELSTEAEDMAVAGIMDALESKDPAAFKEALTTFLEAAGYTK
jgi:hypothetical protein